MPSRPGRNRKRPAPQLALQLAQCSNCDKRFLDLIHPSRKVIACPDGWEFLPQSVCPWCRAYLAAIGDRPLGAAGN